VGLTWQIGGWSNARRGHRPQYAAVVDLGSITPTTLVVAALGVAVLALVVTVVTHLRLSRVQARYRIMWADREKDLIAVVTHQSSKIANLQGDIDGIREQIRLTAGDLERSLRHVAVVRYDDLGDIGDLDDPGGRLSFSAAIIDDRGDGLVISSIHASGESRTHATGIVEGVSEVTLTPQEREALAAARTGEDPS